MLYDAWSACSEGNWKESKFLQNIRSRHSNKKRGTRKWLFASEMDKLFGREAAELMRVRKLESEELAAREVRFHPELPHKEVGLGQVVLHLGRADL